MSASVDFSGLHAMPRHAGTSMGLLEGAIAGHAAFAEIPQQALVDALSRGELEVIELERDQLLTAKTDTSLFYVCEGQVVLGVFRQEDVAQRRALQDERNSKTEAERSLLPLPPLARTANKNLARFRKTDVFNVQALCDANTLALYSTTPITMLRFDRDALGRLTQHHPSLSKALATSIASSERLLRGITGVKQEIFDFYLRHGLSIAGPSVRVRQLDLCIECKQCEDACEERHAAKRLTLGGFRLGMLDFVYSCRTCQDQRCLTPCEHDSISYCAERGEVEIDHAKCIGCSLCAQSCPYGAIDMVNIAEEKEETFNFNLKARLSEKGLLEHGPGKGRSAPPRRVANKCDHCHGFAEQACISACPTGALVELDMARLFGDSGPEELGKKPPKEVLPIKPFTSSVGVKDAGLARIRDGRFGLWIWGLGLLVWGLAATEVALRHFAPTLSLRFQVLLAEGLSPDLAKLGVGYLAGSELALLCGYVGTALMVISMAYPLRRRLRLFMRTASNKYWLDLHLMTGTVGPLFIVLHSALRLDNWVSIPFGSMIMVVASGFLGRYLYTLVPSMTYGHEIEELSLRGQLTTMTAEQPQLVQLAESFIEEDRTRVHSTREHVRLTSLLFWLIKDELRRTFVLRKRRRTLQKLSNRKTAKRIASLCDRIVMIERRSILAPRARLFLKSWKYIHVPFSVLMMVTTIAHIVIALRYSM